MKLTYSAICENWKIDPKAYRDDFEWVKADPLTKDNRLTRELGIIKQGTAPIRLSRVYYDNGDFAGFYRNDTRMIFMGNVSVSARDFRFDC